MGFPVSIATVMGAAFAFALGVMTDASAETTVWNMNVFGPPRAVTAGIEAMAELFEEGVQRNIRNKDRLRRRSGPGTASAQKSIKSGGYEGALMCAGYYPNKFPLLGGDGASLPSAAGHSRECQALRRCAQSSADRQGDGRALEHQVFRADLSARLRIHGQQTHRIRQRHEGREDADLWSASHGAAGVRGSAHDGDGAGGLRSPAAGNDRQFRASVRIYVRRVQALTRSPSTQPRAWR